MNILKISLRPALVATTFVLATSPLMAQYPPNARVNQQRGATVGGIAGAVIGGIIGDHNDEAGAGAAIGGTLGAIAGGVLGNATDKDQQAIRQGYQPAPYTNSRYNPPVRTVAPPRQTQLQPVRSYSVPQGVVTVADVAQMVRSGLSESVIMNQIQARGIAHSLEVSDIITLHNAGVSETLISAMQRAPVGGPATTTAYPAPTYHPPTTTYRQPVIVEERVVVPYHPPRSRRYYPPPRRGTQIRFGF